MTERAQKVKEAFWQDTEYPDDLDEWNLIVGKIEAEVICGKAEPIIISGEVIG